MPILIIEYTFIVSQKYFFCISIVFWCVNSRRSFLTMPADQQRSYKNSGWYYSECNWSISPRRRGCHFGGVFVTGGTEGFHHENLQCGAGASWRWDDGVCISANNLWALDEITHTDTWTVAPLVYTLKSLFYVLILYVFHFKYFSYEYCSNFWVLRV